MSEAATPQPSRLYRLIEERLDGTLAEYVAARRPTASWKTMAAELTETTGIEVSWESLRTWFADRIQIRVTVAERRAESGSAA
jgi:hypothetical protein